MADDVSLSSLRDLLERALAEAEKSEPPAVVHLLTNAINALPDEDSADDGPT